jgi:UPF0271 protein
MDRNCDLGEGEPVARTRALMRWITSANVACGGHAGELASMTACARLSRQYGVRLGAHPGVPAPDSFGRGAVNLEPRELELLLLQQIGVLERVARREGVRLSHVKLHGSLYHASDADDALARIYLQTIRRWWPRCVVFARAGGLVASLGARYGLTLWEEGFADRAYRPDGTLVPRDTPGALLTNRQEVIEQVRRMRLKNEVRSACGARVRLRVKTVCLHSDTPGAVALARALAREEARGGARTT